MDVTVDLSALLQELEAAREQTATWHLRAREILVRADVENEQTAQIDRLLRDGYGRLKTARARLVSLQIYLPALLGPSPPLTDELRDFLDEAEQVHAEVDAASREFGRAIGELVENENPTPDLRRLFDEACVRYERAVDGRRRIGAIVAQRLLSDLQTAADELGS